LNCTGARPQRGDEGIVLILWVFAITALLGCLALSVDLGNLAQQAGNVQNAADSAAISAALILGAQSQSTLGGLVDTLPVGIPAKDRCDSELHSCGQYGWLDGYYLYEGNQWLEIVSSDPEPGQVLDESALADGVASGDWTCTSRLSMHNYCRQLSDSATFDTSDSAPEEWALSDDGAAIEAAISATTWAKSLVQQTYGITADWSGCPGAPATGFSFAVWPGSAQPTTCIEYKINKVNDTGQWDAIFYVDILASPGDFFFSADPASYGVPYVERSAWASSGMGGLCSGIPATPTTNPAGNCY
jgi:Putative Flp pilus-assembly TadE/G-like